MPTTRRDDQTPGAPSGAADIASTVLGASVALALLSRGKKPSQPPRPSGSGSEVIRDPRTESQILFLGAEFTQVYASHYGLNIRPSKNTVPIVQTKKVASPGE